MCSCNSSLCLSTFTVYQCPGRDRPTQLHSREQAHSERYLSFRLSGEPSNTSRRTTRYMPRKEIKMLNVPLSSTTTEPRNASDKRSHGLVQRYLQSNADCQNSQHSRIWSVNAVEREQIPQSNTVCHTKYTSPALDKLSELPSISVLIRLLFPHSLLLMIST